MTKSCDCQPFNSCPECVGKLRAVPKPEPKVKKTKKTKRVKIREIEPPEEKQCRWCEIKTETECYRHCEDPEIKFLFGGGIMADKIDDKMTVWACAVCDLEMSTKPMDLPGSIEYLEWQNKSKLGIIVTWLL